MPGVSAPSPDGAFFGKPLLVGPVTDPAKRAPQRMSWWPLRLDAAEHVSFAQKQNPRHVWRGFCGIKTLAMTYSRMGKATLPSARVRFTSEFGMGSGGSTPLWSPGRGWRVAGEGATLSEVTGHAFRRERNKLDVASSECRDVSRSQGHFSKLRFWKPLEVIWSSHTDH